MKYCTMQCRTEGFGQLGNRLGFDSKCALQKDLIYTCPTSINSLSSFSTLHESIKNRAESAHINRSGRQKRKLSFFIQNIEKWGDKFKAWLDPFQVFCQKCGSMEHSSKTCTDQIPSKITYELIDEYDLHMYDFLLQLDTCPPMPYPSKLSGNFFSKKAFPYLIDKEIFFWQSFSKMTGLEKRIDNSQFNHNENSVGFWWAIGSSRKELFDIFFGTKIFWIKPPSQMEVVAGKSSFPEEMQKSVLKDMEQGKISPVPNSFPHCILPVFIVDQIQADNSVKYRRILNCVPINHLVPAPKFCLPSPELAAKVFSGPTISIDLSGAYFQKKLNYFPLSWRLGMRLRLGTMKG